MYIHYTVYLKLGFGGIVSIIMTWDPTETWLGHIKTLQGRFIPVCLFTGEMAYNQEVSLGSRKGWYGLR